MKSKKDMKKIDINNDVWDQLHNLRKELGYRKLSAVILWLLKHQPLEGGSAKEIDPEKILQDIIGSESWSQVQELMFSHNLNLPGLLRHLIDCHRLIEQEKPPRKLASTEVLEEIYNHVQQLYPPQPFRETDSVDISDDTSATEGEWLVCPICWHTVSLKVEDHSQKPERGFVFEEVNGRFEHRFVGINDKYQPVEVRQGSEIIVEKSMAISTLKRLDQRLHDHIQTKLEDAYFQFSGRRGL